MRNGDRRRRWMAAVALWMAAVAALAAETSMPQQSLLEAIATGDLEAARAAVARGADLNAAGPFQRTPLHAAVKGVDTPLLEWLLAHGANPDARDGDGRTPLHLANQTSAAILLRHRADASLTDRQGNSALHVAAEDSRRMCRLLVEAGVPVNARNASGLTALHFAVLAGKTQVAEELVALGADVNARTVADYSYKPSFVGWDAQGMESRVPASATPVSLARQLHRKNRWVSGNRYAELAEYLGSKGAVE
ncbi:ankyrin repeat domain-containing protein [Accumulibacter sp.]|uniref:ankyrin repeat domain-containing protein n=1 Tax=Accumulibacter sp. TaxID=2053492 RepID=UPI0025EE550D|nr:ankyrin repeat domain-containing protein [Accumulibacter sp.]MCM8611832.1 ankyrin repeat domain-containing protein [Accumulibacter sp.]MCM8635454.1 ankyrin repeat domain-containing protein [Accumulibacter sp.]MCM8639032.1 ankyrin repeat domain-containing protein [Accumulibacter sp.]